MSRDGIVNILILGIHCLASYSCIRKNSDRFGCLYMAFLYHKEWWVYAGIHCSKAPLYIGWWQKISSTSFIGLVGGKPNSSTWVMGDSCWGA